MSDSASVMWSREEEKAFENAIATHWIDDDDSSSSSSKDQQEKLQLQWNNIASMVPTKTVEELKQHYQLLLQDVNAIEAGIVPLPKYIGEEPSSSSSSKDHHGFSSGLSTSSASNRRSNSSHFSAGFSGFAHESTSKGGGSSSRSEQERRKGIPWTEEEHRYTYAYLVHYFTHLS